MNPAATDTHDLDRTSTRSRLQRAGAAFSDLVGRIPPRAWRLPTPCPGWDVTQVVVHTASIAESLVPLATGNRLPPPIDPGELGSPGHTAARVAVAISRGVDAWGSVDLDEIRTFPWGRTPAVRALEFTMVELVGHGWDLGEATGVPLVLDDDVVAATAAVVATHLPHAARPGLFDEPTPAPPDAAPMDRLAALIGRRPPAR